MADLSKIRLNGTTYNFKDTWARTNLQTSSQVQSAITTALGNITGFEISIVQTLPATGDQGTFYFVPNSQGSGNNIYDEYVYVNNSWEKIGTTEIDLSDYLQKTDIAAWAKAATKPAYTANEVGALPDNTIIPSKTSDLTNDSGFVKQFIITITKDDERDNYSADKTFSEITTAYNNGYKLVCHCIQDNSYVPFLAWNNNKIQFELSAMTAESILAAEYIEITNANEVEHRFMFFNETDPVFSASAAAGITSTDISNWNNRVSSINWNSVSHELRVSQYGTVSTALAQSDMRYNSTNNTSGFLTLADLPIYDGTVE